MNPRSRIDEILRENVRNHGLGVAVPKDKQATFQGGVHPRKWEPMSAGDVAKGLVKLP